MSGMYEARALVERELGGVRVVPCDNCGGGGRLALNTRCPTCRGCGRTTTRTPPAPRGLLGRAQALPAEPPPKPERRLRFLGSKNRRRRHND